MMPQRGRSGSSRHFGMGSGWDACFMTTEAEGDLSEDEMTAFTERCQAAVAAVQRDLDRTGLSEFRLQLSLSNHADEWPWAAYGYVGLLSGSVQGEFPQEGLTPEMDDDGLREAAADNASGALLIIEHHRWPRCIDHPTKYMVGGNPHYGLPPDRPGWWWCKTITPTSKPHPVSPIGDLQPNQIVTPYSRPGT